MSAQKKRKTTKTIASLKWAAAPPVDARRLEIDSIENDSYRRVVHTVPDHFQLVLMSLDEGETIPREIHPATVQFIRVERGAARVTVDDVDVYDLQDGDSITIPQNHSHFVENTTKARKKCDRKLKLYTIYTPPEHPATRHQERQPSQEKE